MEWEFIGLEFRNFKGTTVWSEEELEDLVCDVTCAVVHRYWEYFSETFTVHVL
jgi:hypothetical protein